MVTVMFYVKRHSETQTAPNLKDKPRPAAKTAENQSETLNTSQKTTTVRKPGNKEKATAPADATEPRSKKERKKTRPEGKLVARKYNRHPYISTLRMAKYHKRRRSVEVSVPFANSRGTGFDSR